MPFCSECGASQSESVKFCATCGTRVEKASQVAPVRAADTKTALEKEFLKDEGITVTNSRFIVYGQTYAMSGVTSVKHYRKDPERGGPVFLIIIGGLMALGGFSSNLNELGTFGIIVGAIGGLWFSLQRADYKVLLSVSSGEVEALSSKDGDFIGRVITALNEAIVFRR